MLPPNSSNLQVLEEAEGGGSADLGDPARLAEQALLLQVNTSPHFPLSIRPDLLSQGLVLHAAPERLHLKV